MALKISTITTEDWSLLHGINAGNPKLIELMEKFATEVRVAIGDGGYARVGNTEYHERESSGLSILTRDGFPVDSSSAPDLMVSFLREVPSLLEGLTN